jgi:hypothetical protein
MKRILLILALLSGSILDSQAQSWSEMLKSLFGIGSQKETELVPEVKHITASELASTWIFADPVIVYTGSDPVATMAVSALEGQMDGILLKGGVQRGRDRVTFNKRGTMTLEINDFIGAGNYLYTPSTGEITLTLTSKEKSLTITGKSEYKEGVLTLKFDADKALSALQVAAPSLAENDYVKIASSIISSYPGIEIGASFKR